MKSRLAILLWAAGPDVPHLCATPFFQAAAAAAMDAEVEVHFSSKSVLLLVGGAAARIYAGAGRDKSVYDHMQQAARLGAKFLACSDALDAHQVDRSRFVPEVYGIAGAAAFLGRVLDPEWATLVF
ncbi:MAG TPA: DsrE family protein [Casimicrobiaceae bacterium]|nr:DsrE family protein [Casimicrobiaceae bacterium]